VLTGQDSMMADAVEDRLRELYAIEQIVKRLKGGDTLFEEARDRLEEAEGRFIKALSASYNTILFPGIDDIDGSDRLLKVTIDHGLKVGEGDQSAEVQIEKLMADPRANYKLASDLKDDFGQYFSMAESELWPSGANNRRTPWKDIVNRAKCNSGWPWMPGSSGMDTLRTEALKQGRWRMGEDGYIEKGPFPKEKTSVNVTLISTNPETGESLLTLTPRNAGESPVIYFSTKSEVFDSEPQVLDLENFSTLESTLYFKVVDPTGKYECGPATRWVADLKIRHQIEPSADMRKVTLQCSPKAEMYYTLDGSNPKDGQLYTVPFEVGTESARLLIYAKSGEATQTADFQIPNSGDKTIQIDDVKPARLNSSKRVPLDTTEKVFTIINRFKDQMNTRFKGVRIEIGEGENTVRINFGVRYVTAAMIEASVNSLREVLSEADANVAIKITDGIAFENGFEAREFAKLVGIELKPGDIAQEE
ncbi:TPA: chitobiase/beta-hexosaminidase C-terminal domain-containing protein, partial [Enterobacter hormaechei]|nr:chitobiase/beta-hexosaminidase C-terminal domain-containing protein [Enterobacter hormaechei]